jgi:hypothetical protein
MKIFTLILLTLLGSTTLDAQFPPVGTIDFYGLRTISESQVRAQLQIKEGDAAPKSKAEAKEIEKRIVSLPNLVEAQISPVCCDNNGKTMLYVGVREKGIPALTFRPTPKGTFILTVEMIKVSKEFSEAHQNAILKGDVAEDRSAGHSLMKNAEARAIQEKFIPIANRNLNLLRRVLRESADAEHRALAVEVIAYYRDKSVIITDLVYAMKDSNSTVRNNAMRALGLIAGYAAAHPEKNLKIPFSPFVEMLNSIEWTDRNKSSLALAEITEKRNPQLLGLLRRKAIPSLIEMARWKNEGHAQMPLIILARAAGFSEDEIGQAIMNGKREELIARAEKNLLTSK